MKHLTIVLCLLGMIANAQTKAKAKKDTKAETQVMTDRKAEFVGGNAAMEKYIVANLKYQQKLDTDTSIKTRNVFMKFMIDKTGKVTDVSVMKGIKGCKECNDEATRVVTSMPNWNYAIENNQPADAWFTLPITFSKH
jgi:protein TonB